MAARRSPIASEVAIVALVVSLTFPGTILVSGTVMFGAGVLMLTIYLFNRPRFLVPPKLRNEQGVFDDYLLRRKARRSSDAS